MALRLNPASVIGCSRNGTDRREVPFSPEGVFSRRAQCRPRLKGVQRKHSHLEVADEEEGFHHQHGHTESTANDEIAISIAHFAVSRPARPGQRL